MGLISRVSSRTYRKKEPKKRLIMAVGKNKRMSKGSKKGGKKKVVDPFTKKDWYDIKAPNMFKVRQVGKTLVTRTIGNKIAADGLKGRVFDCNQADLQEDGTGYRKFKLICEDVQVKKWQTMIKCQVDVKTTDNYHLRVFITAFTKKAGNEQVKKTTYAQSQQVKQIRKKMTELVVSQVSNADIKELIAKLLPDSIAAEIVKAAQPIYPIQDCYVSKIKVVKKPKVDLHRLAELHGEAGVKVNVKGERVDRGDHYEPPVAEAV